MNAPKLVVRHGELLDLQGPPRRCRDVAITAAIVALRGISFTASHGLAEHVATRNVPSEVRDLMLDGNDGPWARGRIERVFAVQSPGEEERGEKSGLDFGFIATLPDTDGSLVGVPFLCNDYYLRTSLMFSKQADPPPAELTDRIAEAFWEILLADPFDVPDYQDKLYHLGCSVWLDFGIEDGEPFIQEREE